MSKRRSHRKSLEKFFTSVLCLTKTKTKSKSSNENSSEAGENVVNLANEEIAFPEGWFYIKSQINGNVMEPQSLSVNSGARIVVSAQRFGFDADSQLWKYDNGFIVNKESGKVLDIEGDRIRKLHHTYLCQKDRKSLAEATNQRWICRPGGHISLLSHDHYVLDVGGQFGFEKLEGAYILVHHKERNFIKEEMTKLKDDIKYEQKKLSHAINKELHNNNDNGSVKDEKYDVEGEHHAKLDFESSKQQWLFELEHEKPALISPPIPKDYIDYIAAKNEATIDKIPVDRGS